MYTRVYLSRRFSDRTFIIRICKLCIVIKRRNDLLSKNIISSLIKLMEFDFYTLKIDHVECTDR